MLVRRPLLALSFLTFAAFAPLARAQTLPPRITGLPSVTQIGVAPPGVTVVPPGYNDRPQWIIPRNANGRTPPAGALMGWGPMSVVRATADTEKLPDAKRAVVITQDFDKQIRQFQSQAPDDKVLPAVLQPTLRDLTIAGRDVKGDDWWQAGDVDDSGNPGVDKYDGLRWKASGGLIENVNIFGIPGSAAHLTRGCCPNNKAGGMRPFDNEKLKVWNVNVSRANRGIEIAVVDAIVGNLTGHNCKEYTFKFSAGATQIGGAIHSWGGVKGTWLTGDGNWGGPLYCEQGEEPLVIDSNLNDLGPIYSWAATKTCVVVNGNHNTLSQLRIPYRAGEQPIGIAVNGQYLFLSQGNVAVSPSGRGIVTDGIGGWGLRLRDVRVAGGGPTSKCIDLTGGKSGLYYAQIDVQVDGGGIGVDLTRDDGSSALAVRNTINVTTPINTGLTKVVDLPAGWQSTTPRKTSNIITINGVRWYPPKDEG